MEKSLQQYLDLYTAHKDLLAAKSASGFNTLREEAFKSLSTFGLPRKGSENYEITDLDAMLAPDFGLNLARIPLDVNPLEGFRCGIPHLSPALFFMLSDIWAESDGARSILPDGVTVGPLSARLADPDPLYGALADLANPIVALNTMLVQEGLYLHVGRGVRVEKPIQLVNLLEALAPMMALRRLLIVVEDDAEVKFVSCSHASSSSVELASVSVAEIYAGRNSRIDFCDLEESGPAARRLSALYLRQQEGSDCRVESFTLHNGQTRNEYHCSFEGEHAALSLCGLAIEGGESLVDSYSHIRHNSRNCHTQELFKYIADDKAKAAFIGLVYVAPGASGTEAYQSNRNLVGSDTARIFSKPQLEIYNDDVKCSHGSATGQLDAMQMFYLRSRGLDEAEARLMLKQAFMADVLDDVRLPLLRDRLRALVERRLSGHDDTCGSCEICGATDNITTRQQL